MSLLNSSYINIQPAACGTFISEWQNCLSQIIEIKSDVRNRIFKVNYFIHTTGNTDYQDKKKIIGDSMLEVFGVNCPTFGVSANSPELNYKVSAEVGIVDNPDILIYYRTCEDRRYTIIEHKEFKELWANGIESKLSEDNIKSSAENAFEIMHKILETEKMTFDNIIRQWNYIGKIIKVIRHGRQMSQHYQLFNKVRSEYYRKYRSASDFPAATGIGMKHGKVMIDFCAVSGSETVQTISVSNPRQINPYSYDQKVLIGTPEKDQKQPPLFERAKLLIFSNAWHLFVSGTASIIGQETSGIGNLEEQTFVTNENISQLVSKENLSVHYPEIIYDNPLLFSRIRVYVKNSCDIPIVKSICSEIYGKTPSTYLQADICRTNLLVEIEADLSS
jgi:hypothetical protein